MHLKHATQFLWVLAMSVFSLASGFALTSSSRLEHGWHCFELRMTESNADPDVTSEGRDNLVFSPPRIPRGTEDQVLQASQSIQRAFNDGITRQQVKIELPLIGATELDDWPGGIKQQYQACEPMVISLLKKLAKLDEDDLNENEQKTTTQPQILSQVIDADDAVGVLQAQSSDPKKDKLAVIFPNTESIKVLKQLSESAGNRLKLLVNPQWKRVADFGFFGQQDAKKFLEPYERSYHIQSLLVYGRSVRLLRRYPDPWQLFSFDEKTGDSTLIHVFQEGKDVPEYKVIEDILDRKYGRMSVAERIQQSTDFIKDTL